jgi:circadian clock protein KaiB
MKNLHPKNNKNKWALHLYIAGNTQRTAKAIRNLKIICEEKLKDNYQIEVIDLLKNPQIARSEQIIAVPTLVRKLPLPQKSIIGDLSNADVILVGLGLIEPNQYNANHNQL